MLSSTDYASSSSGRAALRSSRDLAWVTARLLSISTCSFTAGLADCIMLSASADDARDTSPLSGTSTGSSSSGEELRCLFCVQWGLNEALHLGDHFDYPPSSVCTHRVFHILLPPSSVQHSIAMSSFGTLRHIQLVCYLSFGISPGCLDSTASEGEEIRHRDAVTQLQMSLVRCFSVRRHHCRRLLPNRLHPSRRPM